MDTVLLLRCRDVLKRYGITKPTLYRWMKAGCFPPPVRLGAKTVRWRAADLDDYDEHLE